MGSHRCEYCGNVFDPVKHGVCPNCGAAVSAAVMAKIEREQAASRARVERMKEDVVRRHEQATRTGQYGMPDRLSNASQSPFRTGRPARPGKTVKNPTAFSLVAIVVCVVLMMVAMNRVRALRDSLPVVNDDPDRPWEENSETVESAAPEEIWSGGLGDTLRDGTFEVSAVALRDYEMQWYEKNNLAEDRRIIAVELRVKNISDAEARPESIWGLAYDADGEALNTTAHAPNDAERANSLSTAWLRPGSETVGRVFYEVPENAATLELHVEGLMVISVALS